MRKIALWLGLVPASIRKIIDKVLPVTTKLRKFLESGFAYTITDLIPGNADEALRAALVLALREFEGALNDAKAGRIARSDKKRIAGMVGKYIIAHIDGFKHPGTVYDTCFEKVYQEQKTYVVAA